MHHDIELITRNNPFITPNAARQGSGGEPLVLPKAHNHAAVRGVVFDCFDKALSEIVSVNDPTVGSANGAGEVFFGLVGMKIGEELVDIAPLVGAVFFDLPLVPDFDAPLAEPFYAVALGLPNPKHFKHGALKGNEFSSEYGELFLQVEL